MDLAIFFNAIGDWYSTIFGWTFTAFGNSYTVQEVLIYSFMVGLVIYIFKRIF